MSTMTASTAATETDRVLSARAALSATVSAWGARLAGVLASTASFPLVVQDLSARDCATYVILTALTALLPFVDLGVGLSLVTLIGQSRNSERADGGSGEIASTAIVLLLGLTVLSALVGTL